MPKKRSNPRGRQRVIDLTLSDGELEVTDSRLIPNVTLPDPSNPTRPRRLTAAECLRADRIAFGEIDPVSDSYTRYPSSQPWIGEIDLVCDSTIPVFDDQPDNTRRLTPPNTPWPVTPDCEFHDNDSEHYDAAFHQGYTDGLPLQEGVSNLTSYARERSQAPSARTFPEAEDSSDHDSVFDEEEDITSLTWSEEMQEAMEKMASGRPRRACAPRSFAGLLKETTFRSGEFVNAKKGRANLIERATVAHRELWKNRLVCGFSYSCGKIDDGNARSTLIQIAQSFGARVKVEKRKEPGKKGKKARHVVMRPSTRLRSPFDINIQESADQIMSRLRTFGDSSNVPQPVNDIGTVQTKARGLEKKHRKKEEGSAKVEIATEPKPMAESQQEDRKTECAFESGDFDNQEALRADLIERAIIAYNELWENRMVDNFSHSCGAIDDGDARAALIQITQSFGARVRVEKRKESGKGKKAKHVVVKCSTHLRSPPELNVREKAESILRRRYAFSPSDSHNSKDPRVSTLDGTTNGVQHACTTRTRAADHHKNATKREFCSREDTERAVTMDSRKAMFHQKRQRKLEGTKIGTTNKGFSMLTKMGWTEGGRLGAKGNGISEPIVAQFRVGRSGLGNKQDGQNA